MDNIRTLSSGNLIRKNVSNPHPCSVYCSSLLRNPFSHLTFAQYYKFEKFSEKLCSQSNSFWPALAIGLVHKIHSGADTRGGGRCPPMEVWGRGRGGGPLFWLNNCQNILITRWKYIKITFKEHFGPHRIFIEGS